MRRKASRTLLLAALGFVTASTFARADLLGLPPPPIPADNPQSDDKIALGKKLFHDKRFSGDGTVACSTCHEDEKAFTDSPRKTSRGISGQFGTRNAPTVLNAAYFDSFFWDGRAFSLEDQSQFPFLNPIEMGLASHDAILKIVREDPEYKAAFIKVFGTGGSSITMEQVKQAIASFERTLVSAIRPSTAGISGTRTRPSAPTPSAALRFSSARDAASPATRSSRTARSSPTTASTTSASASTAFNRTCRVSPPNSRRRKPLAPRWTRRCSPTPRFRTSAASP